MSGLSTLVIYLVTMPSLGQLGFSSRQSEASSNSLLQHEGHMASGVDIRRFSLSVVLSYGWCNHTGFVYGDPVYHPEPEQH